MNTTQNTTQYKTNVFSSSRGGCLNWDDEPAANQPHQPHQEHEPETDDSQSIDSDHSSDFWHNWSPTVDRMIVARHATYLKELEAQIAVGQATLQKVREQIKKQAPPPPPPPPPPPKPTPTPKKPPTTTPIPSNNPFATYWKFPCQPGGKEPRCK